MRALLIKLAITFFLIGIVVRSLFYFGDFFWIFLLMLSILFLVIYFKKEKVIYLFVVISLIALSVGVIRMDTEKSTKAMTLEELINKNVILDGVVVTDPEEKEKYKRYVIQVSASGQKILIYGSHEIDISYGNLVSVSGKLQKPEHYYSGSNKSFDWVAYLSKDDIYYEMFYPDLEILGYGKGNFIMSVKRNLFELKKLFINRFSQVIPEPESSLLAGELLGEKASLGRELETDFRRTGIIHVVVLSGYNVTIVADSIIKSISFLPKTLGLYLGIAGIVLFAIMTGAGATVVRASIMAILVIFARCYGKQYNISTSLFLAGGLMVLHSPNILLYDASFQLSFLASVGLIYISPKIEKYFSFVTQRFNLRTIIGATMGTQLMVMPLLIYLTREVSLVSLPVNILILPVVPITMFLGFVTGMCGLLSYSLSLIPGWLTTIVLMYQLSVVEIFAHLPFTTIVF